MTIWRRNSSYGNDFIGLYNKAQSGIEYSAIT